MSTGLEKNNSNRIGFVSACLFHQALELSELNKWAEVSYENDLPSYMLNLMEFDAPLFHLSKVIGFVPVWNRTSEEENALYGIAYSRREKLFDCPISKAEALKILGRNSHILDRFKQEFPFLELPAELNK
jgi:hypothetical protein